jgi:hypothetical protein
MATLTTTERSMVLRALASLHNEAVAASSGQASAGAIYAATDEIVKALDLNRDPAEPAPTTPAPEPEPEPEPTTMIERETVIRVSTTATSDRIAAFYAIGDLAGWDELGDLTVRVNGREVVLDREEVGRALASGRH